MRKVFLLLSLLAVLGWAAELRVAISTEPPSLDPTTNAAAVIRLLLQYNLYETLLEIGEGGGLRPLLAQHWEISEDGLVYTFYLRPGVRFHDGTPCDAEAVRRSFLRAQDPARGHVHRPFFLNIERIEVPDALTVRFFLRKPDASFLTLLALGDAVVVPDRDDLGRRPIGTGPFRFVRWDPGYQLRLERNPFYWDPERPKLDALVFRFIPDPAAQLVALRAGDVDVVAEVTPEIAQALAADPAFVVLSAPQELVQVLAINKQRGPLGDLRVRQALAHAVDRRQLIELVALGYASPVGSHLAPGALYYADMTWVYPYDPERARQLLAEAGYPNGFTATLTLPSNYVFHVRTGEVLAAQLAQVEVKLNLVLVDWPTWLERVFGQADFELTVIGHVGRVDPALTLAFYGPERREYYFRRGWENPELNELLRLGAVVADPEARRSIYTVAQYLITKEVVNVFLQSPHRILVARRGVSGLRLPTLYVLDLRAAARA
ncbi:MAG: ABC transporter substrate-binding protein [Candidatus Bipolaricaulota bacterium]|nr:ABC transporter substrate-binding protein [Candidatus Bipolaricaulota bacterium]MDW8151484.1 ABC transporter substrate-binding protein [Candidatus Bipolaricaulota bacterium]